MEILLSQGTLDISDAGKAPGPTPGHNVSENVVKMRIARISGDENRIARIEVRFHLIEDTFFEYD